MTLGPELPIPLSGHCMVPLELGLAIIGGETNEEYTKKTYHLKCSQKTCDISKLGAELSIARGHFVAIPIPDHLSGCVTEGKGYTLNHQL